MRIAAEPTEPPGGTLRVLLVEDNPMNRRVALRMLERAGHAVTEVETGLEAVVTHARDPHDVVLMDVQMPGMDGLEATIEIRKGEAETGRHVPIIALTACAMSTDRERCLAAGMDDYLTKPLQAADLHAAIDRATAGVRERPPRPVILDIEAPRRDAA